MAFRVTGKDGDVIVTTDHQRDAVECAKQYAASIGETATVSELMVNNDGELVPDPDRVKTYKPRRGTPSVLAVGDEGTNEESPEPSRKPTASSSTSAKTEADK